MRSLFAKILGWFVLTVVVTLTAAIMISALSYNPYSSARPTPLSMLLSVEMSEARHAWESGGRAALAETAGVTAFCSGEFVDHEAYSTLAEMALHTQRALVGPGIAYAFARTTPPARAKLPAPRWCSVCSSALSSRTDHRPLTKMRSSAAAATTSPKQVS